MKRLIQFFFFAPLAIVLIALSVANRHEVRLSFDPFSATDPAITFSMPLYWLIFGCLAVGVLVGGFVVWAKQGRFRREARDQRFEAAKARHEAKKIKQQAKEQANLLSKNALPAPKAS